MPEVIEEASPCKNCPNVGIDKRLCSDYCRRLKAWRAGRDWTKEEIYIVPEGKDLVEDIENGVPDTEFTGTVDIDHINLEFEDADGEPEEIEADPEELIGSVKRITTETNWKKAMAQKKKKHKVTTKAEKCLYCGRLKSADNLLRRGLCLNPCYMSWYKGRIEHPEHGVFKKLSSIEASAINKKETKTKEAFIVTPKTTLPGKIAVSALSAVNASVNKDTDICPNAVHLDMSQYPQIMKLIDRMTVDLALPVTHIIVTLLAEALANRNKQGKNGCHVE